MLDIKEYLKQTKTVLLTQDAFDELMQMAFAQPERKWIPCSERLPAYGEDVLITTDDPYHCNIGHILRENGEEQYCWFFSGWYHEPNEVAAWMPFPEPYKEGQE